VISTISEESFANVRTVKAFATEDRETIKFDEGNLIVYYKGKYKSVWYGAFNFFANLFAYSCMALLIYLGAKEYEAKAIELGTITSFLLYLLQLLF